MEHYLAQSRRILRALGNYFTDALQQGGIDVEAPHGGFYLFPNFDVMREKLAKRGIFSSDQLCKKLLEDTGVAVLPGTDFGRPADELTARLAYVDFDGARVLTAADNLPKEQSLDETFLKTYCENCTDAIDRVVDWVMD